MLRRQIRRLLQNKIVPAAIYARYFERQLGVRQALLSQKLAKSADLMADLTADQRQYWADRINLVMKSPDNAAIPRVKQAGQIGAEGLIMHNGLRVDPLSYYSFPMLQMLVDNGGVHEPQEEKIFQEVLAHLPPKANRTMLELGAYWAFYSMWFQQRFPDAQCYMVEPDRKNLFFGKKNFQLNDMQGTFLHFGIGKAVDRRQNITTVDVLCRTQRIRFLDILHADIQGFELDMLQGAEKMLSEGRVGYVFISTHSNELHTACEELLAGKYGMHTVAGANLDESYSWDGILVMKAPGYPGINEVIISKRNHKEVA